MSEVSNGSRERQAVKGQVPFREKATGARKPRERDTASKGVLIR